MKPHNSLQEGGRYYKISFHRSRCHVPPRAAKMYAAILILSFSAAVLAVPLPYYGAYRSKCGSKDVLQRSTSVTFACTSLQCRRRLIPTPNKCKPYNKVRVLHQIYGALFNLFASRFAAYVPRQPYPNYQQRMMANMQGNFHCLFSLLIA